MIPIKELKEQHEEIRELVNILSILVPNNEARATKIVQELFTELDKKIKKHFAMENNTLYRELLVHNDPKIKHTAEGFMSGSRELKRFFSSYLHHLHHQNESEEKGIAFVKETEEIFELLKKRIKVEEDRFYPLA